jgi:hypothetical protein
MTEAEIRELARALIYDASCPHYECGMYREASDCIDCVAAEIQKAVAEEREANANLGRLPDCETGNCVHDSDWQCYSAAIRSRAVPSAHESAEPGQTSKADGR